MFYNISSGCSKYRSTDNTSVTWTWMTMIPLEHFKYCFLMVLMPTCCHIICRKEKTGDPRRGVADLCTLCELHSTSIMRSERAVCLNLRPEDEYRRNWAEDYGNESVRLHDLALKKSRLISTVLNVHPPYKYVHCMCHFTLTSVREQILLTPAPFSPSFFRSHKQKHKNLNPVIYWHFEIHIKHKHTESAIIQTS